MNKNEKELIKAARLLTWINPSIDVLKKSGHTGHNGLVQSIEQVLQNENTRNALLLPELRKHTDVLSIFSDYGGESNESNYYVYSFLICDFQLAYHFLSKGMSKIRKKHNLNDKELSFKDLRHGPTKRSLKEYLELLDKAVPGFLYTVVIDKKVQTVFGASDEKIPDNVVRIIKECGFGSWKRNTAEKLLRIIHIAAYLTGLFSKDGQKLFWMTDHDAIVPNKPKQMKTMKLFCNILPLYTSNKFDFIGGAVPFKEKSTNMLDLLSSTDLVAGAVEHYMTRHDKMEDLTIKEEADTILQWLTYNGVALKKRVTMIKLAEKSSIIGANLVFELKDPPKNVIMVSIAM
ncbi:MAG: hypothetical protein ACUZ8E_15180 [Candidatus Anammoxibacter sp.]